MRPTFSRARVVTVGLLLFGGLGRATVANAQGHTLSHAPVASVVTCWRSARRIPRSIVCRLGLATF